MFHAENSETLAQARLARHKPHWVLQILIFLLVYFAVGIATAIVSAIPVVIALFGNGDFMAAAVAGDIDAAINAAAQVGTGNSIMLLSLFLTVIETAFAIIYCRCIEKRSLRSMGFSRKHAVPHYLVGFLFGILLLLASAGISAAFGAISFRLSTNINVLLLLGFLLGYLIQGMAEEVLLRGCFMVSLANRVPLAVAVAVSSVMFSLLHLSNPGITALALVNIALFGILMALYFLRTDSIWGACALHSAWNYMQGNIMGIQVSGLDQSTSLFTATADPAGSLIHGGAFGLEGGLAVTIVLVIAIGLVLFIPKKNKELC